MSHEAPSFTTADYLVFMASLSISLGIGFYHWFRSRGKGTEDFLMGGGHMSPIPVSLSFMAGSISAISILGNSAEMYYYGTQLWTNNIGVIFGTIVVIPLIIPVIHPLKLVTIYAFLEHRWRSRIVRKVASLMQLLSMIPFMGIALYAPSLAISSVTSITTNTSVLALGIVCSAYASLGGAKAVVYTDTFQSLVMVAGVIIVIVQGCVEVGGGANSWAIDYQNDRIQFINLSMDPLERHTLMSVITMGITSALSMGCSQIQFMRWGSVASLSQSYLVMVLGTGGIVGLCSLIYYSGLVVYSVYADCDPLTAGYIEKVDQILMYFVADKLGYLPGILGLFVAALYSGVMSSVSSSINALSAIVWKDMLQSMSIFTKVSEEKAKNINIFISACGGMLAVCLGILAGSMTSILQIILPLVGALGAPLTGIFFTALLCPWVKELSVCLASLIALAFNIWVLLGNFFYAPGPDMLPLSVDGCLDPGFNSSTSIAATTTITTTTMVNSKPPVLPGDEDVFPLYRLSYGFYGAIGILVTIVLSTVLSCFVGFESPSDVPASCVNRTCLRFYCWLRREEEVNDITGATSASQSSPGDVCSTISNYDSDDSARLHNCPEIMMKPQRPNSETPGLDNPGAVDDFL